MAETKVSEKGTQRQEVKEQDELSSGFFELYAIERLLRHCEDYEAKADTEVLLLLIRTTIAKMDYFQQKYGFEIDVEDRFYVADALKFAAKKASQDAERREFLKSQGHDVSKLY